MPNAHFNFFDTALLDAEPQVTRDGYIKSFARIARTGIQTYKGIELKRPDLDNVKVYRPDDEVFHADAMRSLAHRPLTLNHPNEDVKAGNWRRHAVGYTGDEVVRDGDHVRVPLMLCDHAAIAAYKAGIKQLSVGYSADIDWTPGKTPDGQSYDAAQRGIRANHVAIVPEARGGNNLKIGDVRKCPKCDAPVSAFNKTCTTCGHKLGDQSMGDVAFTDDNTDTKTCWSCDQRIPDDTKVCPFCREAQDHPAVGGDDDIQNEDDLQNAIKAMARGKNFSAQKVRIVKAAKRLGKVRKLPEDWNISDAVQLADGEAAINVFDKEFSTAKRKQLAKKGQALPGGGYPIENKGDLGRAIQAFGRAKDPEATKRHIVKRARALGATADLPESWKVKDSKGDGSMIVINDRVVEMSDEAAALVQAEMKKLKKQLADARRARDTGSPNYSTGPLTQVAGGGQVNDNDDDDDDDDDDADKVEKNRRRTTKEDKKYKDAIAARDGEIAVLKKKIEDAKAATSAEALDKAVTERTSLLDAAMPILGQNFDPRGKSNDQIRRAAVVAANISDADKMSDGEILGAFKALTAQPQNGNGYSRMADGMSRGVAMSDRDIFNQRSNNGPRNGVQMRDEAFVAKERYLNTAWQGNGGYNAHGHNTNDFGRR